jgi:hypothetical protein
MQRHNQTLEELISSLSQVPGEWKDDLVLEFINHINAIDYSSGVSVSDIEKLLNNDYDTSILLFRLILIQSSDEFKETQKALFYDSKVGFGKSCFKKNPNQYAQRLADYGLLVAIIELQSKTYTWRDIVQERLMMGRGSAIKGQSRGKYLEDFVEELVKEVFDNYDVRKSFVGATGLSTAKADFCIPSKDQPNIVIEVKAYGATGSKQSDVIGDVNKIIDEKRNDTYFILVTDGVTWVNRMKDFQRLITAQNLGKIYRIYTQSMRSVLLADLKQLKEELGL